MSYLGLPSEEKGNRITFKKDRKFKDLRIQNVSVTGGDVDEAFISFFRINPDEVLAISELPLLEHELGPVERYLMNLGGVISAIHNHWLYDNPKVYYLHWQIRGDYEQIAERFSHLWNQLCFSS